MFPRYRLRKRNEVAGYLAAGRTYAETAELTGVAVRTIGKWVKEDPEFRRAIEEQARRLTESDREAFPIARKTERLAALQDMVDAVTQSLDGRAKLTVAEMPMVRELRELVKEAAAEMGDRTQKIELDDVTGLTPEQRAARIAGICDALRARRDREAAEG